MAVFPRGNLDPPQETLAHGVLRGISAPFRDFFLLQIGAGKPFAGAFEAVGREKLGGRHACKQDEDFAQRRHADAYRLGHYGGQQGAIGSQRLDGGVEDGLPRFDFFLFDELHARPAIFVCHESGRQSRRIYVVQLYFLEFYRFHTFFFCKDTNKNGLGTLSLPISMTIKQK